MISARILTIGLAAATAVAACVLGSGCSDESGSPSAATTTGGGGAGGAPATTLYDRLGGNAGITVFVDMLFAEESGAYHTATVDYRYTDYMASVSVTRIPRRGVILREHYISAQDQEADSGETRR